jgi:hypothetical protein
MVPVSHRSTRTNEDLVAQASACVLPARSDVWHWPQTLGKLLMFEEIEAAERPAKTVVTETIIGLYVFKIAFVLRFRQKHVCY